MTLLIRLVIMTLNRGLAVWRGFFVLRVSLAISVAAIIFSAGIHTHSAQAWSGRIHAKIAVEAVNYSDNKRANSQVSVDSNLERNLDRNAKSNVESKRQNTNHTRLQLNKAGTLLAKSAPRLYKKWLKQGGHRFSEHNKAIAWLGVWPDMMKSQSLTALLNKYGQHHKAPDFLKTQKTGAWHYDNVFFYKNTPAHTCSKRNKGQLFSVLSQLEQQLQQPIQSDVLHAMYLSFYIHFYSDAHQPLHIVSRVNKGCWHDKGGNDVCLVKRKNSARCKVNLHQYWDRAAYQNIDNVNAPITDSSASFYTPDKPEFKAALLNEATQVYRYIYPVITPNSVSFDQALTSSYQQKAKKVTAQRVSLTIKRLSRRLDDLFSMHKKAP